jgi:hypothetical protein
MYKNPAGHVIPCDERIIITGSGITDVMVSFEFDIVDKCDDDCLVETAVTLSVLAFDELLPQLSHIKVLMI